MSSLLITSHTPVLRGGRAMRVYAVIRALAELGPLDVAYVRFGAQEPGPELRCIPGVRYIPIVPSRGPRRLQCYAQSRLHGVPPAFARGVSAELVAAADRLSADLQPERLVADGPTVAAALRRLSGHRPVLYLAHNLESSFRHTLGASGFGRGQTLASFERGVLERAHEAWMCSARDIELGRQLAPTANLRYVPNVVDVSAIAPASKLPRSCAAIFVASLAYEPNRRALRFLLDEVLPRVWQDVPEAGLLVVGTQGESAWASDPRVEWLGFVDDLSAAYVRAAVCVVPLLEGGGSPVKFIEGLAYALPVLATPVAAQGLAVEAGRHYVAASGAEQFAAALSRLLVTGSPEIAAAGRSLAERQHSVEALVSAISR